MATRTAIECMLGSADVSIEGVAPDTTVLEWLRESAGRKGTKEGCASGDCGACTVVLCRLDAGSLIYETITSCITPIGAIDGRQLITVEDLGQNSAEAPPDAADLHPTQRAMIRHHASQCGFCTPGFVMSMFCMSHRNTAAEREHVTEGLSGNLCRCTGYRPIIDASLDVLASPQPDHFDHAHTSTLATLGSLANNSLETRQNDIAWFAPRTIDEALERLVRFPDTRMVSGATDFGLEITQNLVSPDNMMDLTRIAALQELSVESGHWVIGAGVSVSRLKDVIASEYPGLPVLLSRYGSPAIRHRATIGGSLGTASPVGDWAPVLIAMNARVELTSLDENRSIAVADFFTDYRKTVLRQGELIRRIVLPRPDSDETFAVYKISKRFEDDISSVCGAIRIRRDAVSARITEATIAFGAMAAIPARARAAEAALIGRRLDEASIKSAAKALKDDFTPLSDARASAAYRIRIAGNLLHRFLAQHQDGEPQSATA